MKLSMKSCFVAMALLLLVSSLYSQVLTEPDTTPYNFLPVSVNLNSKNPANSRLGTMSEKYNWNKEDAVPDLIFNEILWQGIKGVPAPSPVRAAFLILIRKQMATTMKIDQIITAINW